MSLLRDQGSQTLRDHGEAADTIISQLDQIGGLVDGLLIDRAVNSRLEVIGARILDMRKAAAELEQAADRAHGLGIAGAVE